MHRATESIAVHSAIFSLLSVFQNKSRGVIAIRKVETGSSVPGGIVVKKAFLMAFRLSLVAFASLFNLGAISSYAAELVPPAQDYYLHFNQWPLINPGGGLNPFHHQHAAVDTPGDLFVSDALTVEAWILWEGTDLEEIQAATGIDLDKMTLLCGQNNYGFRYRSDGIEGWTFFLQTEEGIFHDTGNIPLPLGQWTHLAATYDGTTIRTFLNGNQQIEMAVSGNIPTLGGPFGDCPGFFPEAEIFGIGLGFGFRGGIRQLRIWNRALPGSELASNAGLHLEGTESGLVGYWPLDGPPNPLQAPNKVAGSPPLLLGIEGHRPEWQLTDPFFVVREDLAEDVMVTDCPSITMDWQPGTNWLVDAQDDGDLDLIFAGTTGECGRGLVPFRAMIRDGQNGFVFDTPGVIAGAIPLARYSFRGVTADFNGDGRLDIFSANLGFDGCFPYGGPNTLLLSRPDGRLEDASGNLLTPPCNADAPQFEGQHMCFAGDGEFGRPPGLRYPGTDAPVPLDPDFTHGVAAGDIDGDGDVDILAGNRTLGLELPYLLINDGNGGFLADYQLLPDVLYGSQLIGEEPTWLPRLSPLNYSLDDLDGDGHVDLVIAPEPTEGGEEYLTGIHWNDGSGDFSTAETMVILPTPGIPDKIDSPPSASAGTVALDIDDDGDKDLLVLWDAADFGKYLSSLQVLVNQGGRVFIDETVKRVGAPPQAGMPKEFVIKYYVEDFNRDGCPDLLFPDDPFFTRDAVIWLNNCQGYFSPMEGPVLPKLGSSYIPLDFDGDGDTDLISEIPRFIGYAGTQGCRPGEDPGEDNKSDYIDFAVLLNVNPAKFKSELIFKDGVED
jgi:hypothetical protein